MNRWARGLDTASPLLGIAEPGDSWLHRSRPGAKLGGLLVLTAGIGVLRLLVPGAVSAVVLVGFAGLLVVTGWRARLRRGLLRAQVRRIWWVLAALALVQWWNAGPAVALTVVTGLVCCLWAATLVTATTPVPAMLDSVVAAARPLRSLGVDPDRVALALTLTISSIPVVGRLLAESREAAAARGLDGDPRALLVPTVVRTVAHAESLGEALAARGLD